MGYDKIYNMQLTQPVNCHIIIIERSPLTLWSRTIEEMNIKEGLH